jgi:hypothetical protein
VEDARSGEVSTEQLLQELNEYQDAGVDVARLVSGFAVAVADGDVDTAALTGGNASENNALCGGICIGVIAVIVAGYTTYSGDGDPLQGLAVIGSGSDPLSQAVAAGTSAAVEWSATEYPDQTAAVLGVLEATGNAIDATVTYVDDATGNAVSRRWNEIPEHTRNQIKGGAQIASIFLPAGSIKALKQLKNAGRLPDAPNRGVCSFHTDTLVLTDGGLLPISDVNTNMSVWSRDPANGDMAWQSVQAQYSNPYDETVSVTMRDVETGVEQTIVSNRIHPYFVQTTRAVANSSEGHVYTGPLENGHWVDAAQLQAGDRLLNDDGTWAEVVSVEIEAEPLTAFNLTVAEFHTYFVAANENAAPVWVHNDCWDALPSGAQPTGARNQFGQETFTGANGEQIYRGNDGRFYDANIHAPSPPSLTISNSQWGTKSAQHMRDFDLDVSNPAHRQQFRDMVENMGSNPDQVVTGTFSGGGPTGRRDVLFYVQGNDVVVTSPAGEFVTVLQNGVTNPNVVRALGQ